MASEKPDSQKKATVLGDFALKKKLGQGGMGTVYLGHQKSLDRPCAVKVLSKEFAAKPGFVERFTREARAMAKIDHPNVVSCYAIGEHSGWHYVAMELIDGQSMQDWINELGQIPVGDAVLVAILCGEALHHAHELNMIHRDVKPDNILITRKGVVKVSDMGLAKAVDDEDMSLTQSGTGLGTPHYMAPEQARNAKHVDRRTDIYALGGTLYAMLTGKTPFAGESVLELIMNKEKGKFTPAKQLNSAVPERLSLIIDKSMSADPNHRYQTCADFVKDLEALQAASEALSFIDPDQRTIVRRSGGAASDGNMRTIGGAGQQTLGNMPPSGRSANAEVKARRSNSEVPARKSEGDIPVSSEGNVWYVKHESSAGKVKVGKMTTPQILTAMKTDKLNLKTQASLNAKGPFRPLAQIPVFEDEAKRMLVRTQTNTRNNNLAAEYDKLAKQFERRKWWRYFGRLVDGTLGFVGLLIWLAIIAGVGIGLYFLVPMVFDMIAANVGLEKPTPETPPSAPTAPETP
ncbi:MAG: serine/threonine protein kinase [Planctomycetaceae bacterium]|nr:serine/threonine protein kinase [Planctomycetaceae bacterium]